MTFFIIDRYCLVRFSSSDPLSKTVLLPLDYFLLIEVKIIFMFAVPCFLSCFSCVCLCATLWTIAYQSPLSMGFSRQEYWSGLPCPPPGDLPNPGSYPHLLSTLHWQVCYLPLAYHGKPQVLFIILQLQITTKFNILFSHNNSHDSFRFTSHLFLLLLQTLLFMCSITSQCLRTQRLRLRSPFYFHLQLLSKFSLFPSCNSFDMLETSKYAFLPPACPLGFFFPYLASHSTSSFGYLKDIFYLSSVQSLSRVQLFAIPQTAVHQASLFITNSQSLHKLMSIELVMPSNRRILCCPLFFLPSIFPSIRIFSNESVLHIRWPKYWSFSLSISPSKEYSGLISFRTDWLDLLAVQGTLKSLLQHHSSKASILCPTLTSIHDHWKNHSLDQDLCWQSNISAF